MPYFSLQVHHKTRKTFTQAAPVAIEEKTSDSMVDLFQSPEIQSNKEPENMPSIKAIIERDYTDSNHVRFFEACPVRIKPLIDPETVINTVRQINEILKDVGSYGGAQQIFENVVSAMTLYLANPLLPHTTKDSLQKLTEFIKTENEAVYKPRGLLLLNPVSQALLQLEFHVILE